MIKKTYNYLKEKAIKFKKWLILIIFGAAVVAAPLVMPNVPDVALEKIQQKYEASELKGKYRLEKTAFILDAVDENAIQAEVGNKTLDKFTPELTLRKWSDEVNFKVKYKHSEKEKDQKVDIENKKIKWKGKKTEVHYYDIKKGELLHDKVLEHDVFEVEVILLEKPDTNIVGFDIETTGLSFYYQPELTQEEKDEGAFRPENVIGSYAVYHESKQGDYSQMGKKNYRAGKAFHIYRPKIIDNAGTEVWGELNITDNLLTVEIPQEFLDNAVYPVIVDPTFGYYNGGTPGGSLVLQGNNDIYGSLFTSPADVGTADSISMYTAKYFGSVDWNFKGIIVLHSNLNIITNGVGAEVAAAQEDWVTSTFGTSPDLTASTDYVLSGIGNTAGYWFYDDGDGTTQGHKDTSNDYTTPTNPTDAVHEDRKYSIYCTYTAGGGAERRMFLVE